MPAARQFGDDAVADVIDCRLSNVHLLDAVRALAFKWIRILWKCWHDGVPYDEAKYLQRLREKGSPLVQNLPVAIAS